MTSSKQLKRVLLVCDEDSLCQTLKQVLEQAGGYSVYLLADFDAARAALAEAHYDVVIVNVVNDPAEATSFCEEVKATSPAQLVAFLAGRWTYIPSDACADKILPKDEGPSRLLAALQQVLVQD